MSQAENPIIHIIGAGLAGSEAAWQAAQAGCRVRLYEMRPDKTTPVHQTPYFGELVCSNSLRAAGTGNAVGLLKEEMRRHGSLIMACADQHRVPAGGALAVDRLGFCQAVTEAICQHPNITVVKEEVTSLEPWQESGDPLIIASGPLTSDGLAAEIAKLTKEEYLHFHDAVAPIVDMSTINMNIAFRASRYGRGELEAGDYINCPMNKEQYLSFYQALVEAETVPLHDFETEKEFSGCMPIETMAKKGLDTIRFGPLKPVGLTDPHQVPDENGRVREAYAVVQLRQDNAAGTMYNIVGFQTRLTWPEQRRVFRLIPGLEQAEFMRYGVMHRNTYIQSPKLLSKGLSMQDRPNIYFAGQITGVEGYIESAACGMAAGINCARATQEQKPLVWPATTALGGLLRYITTPNADFQPMNVTFGLIEGLGIKVRKKREKNELLAKRSLEDLDAFFAEQELCFTTDGK